MWLFPAAAGTCNKANKSNLETLCFVALEYSSGLIRFPFVAQGIRENFDLDNEAGLDLAIDAA